MSDDPSHASTRWVELVSLQAQEAQLLTGRLQSEGIDAWTDPPEVGAWPGYPYGGLGQRAVKVMVPEERLEEAARMAREILES